MILAAKKSAQNTHLAYNGKPLESATEYFWKVMVWDNAGKQSAWSETANFTTGLFTKEDWKGASWIAWKPQEEWKNAWWKRKEVELQNTEFYLPAYFGTRMSMWERHAFNQENPYDPAPLYRKELKITKKIKSAKVFISGLGYYELFINGSRIGDHVLDPGWTNYKKTVLYSTFDVTKDFRVGENAIGVMLGRGNYGQLAIDHWGFYKQDGYIGQPKLLCRFAITYTDGSEEDIVSDLSWKVTGGPIVYDGPHMGELYDATKEIEGWNKPGLNDKLWDNVQPAPSPGGVLKAQLCEPIRIVKEFHPIAIKQAEYDAQIIDVGTNMAGWIKLKVNAPKGTRIGFYYGENEDPRAYGQPGGYQQMAYIAKGEKGEIAECHFSYKGFRYVGIVGHPSKLTIDDIVVCQVNSDVEKVGNFTSSDTTLNMLHEICAKAMISNLHSIPTDCPHREKNGWLGDAVTGMEYGMANYNLAALMTKFTHDIFDTQDSLGRIALIAPDNNYGKGLSPLWASAGIHVPWYMYNYYGDTRLFETYWDKMKLFTQSVWKFNGVENKHGIFKDVLADWSSPLGNNAEEGAEVYTTMNFYLVLKRMATIASILGKETEVIEYGRQAEVVRDALYQYCFDSEKMIFVGLHPSEYRQGPNVLALQNEIVKLEHKEEIVNSLIKDITENRENHFYGGIFTGHALWEYLPRNHQQELCYKVAINPTYPGYGYMIQNGATTLWEEWADRSSHIHHFLGFVDNFLIRHVAGLDAASSKPGFSEVVFAPKFIEELNHAKAGYESIQGFTAIEWIRQDDKSILVNLTVPCNTTGKLMLPGNYMAMDSKGTKLKIEKAGASSYVPLSSGKQVIKLSKVL